MTCLICGEPIDHGAAVVQVQRVEDRGVWRTMRPFGAIHFNHLATEGAR